MDKINIDNEHFGRYTSCELWELILSLYYLISVVFRIIIRKNFKPFYSLQIR